MNEWDKEYDKHRSITNIGSKTAAITEVYDNVHKPKHYIRCGVECRDMIRVAVSDLSGFEAYVIGSAIKYLWRWKDKNGIEDLKKAREFLNMLIED